MGTSTLTTVVLSNLVTKGYEKIFNAEWPRRSRQYEKITKTINADNKTWLGHGITGFGAMPAKVEGSAPTKEDIGQKYAVTFTMVPYGKLWTITHEMIKDDQYEQINDLPVRAAESAAEVRETQCANLYINAFSTVTSPDGRPLIDLIHPLRVGTQANELTNPATLEKQSLRDLRILMHKMKDDGGTRINQMPGKLVVPIDLVDDGEELVKSPLNPDTDTNAVNVAANRGLELIASPYLTDADACYVTVKDIKYIYFILREDVSQEVNPQVDGSRNINYDVYQRFDEGVGDYRDIVGTPGTT